MPLKTWAELRAEADAAPKTSFEPLPPGPYNIRVEKVEHRISQEKSKDGFNVSAIVLNGPYEGRKIFNTFYVSPDSPTAMGIFFRHMDALGIPGEFFDTNPSIEAICQALTNKVAVFTVKQEPYNGKIQNKLTNVTVADPAVVAAASSPIAGVPSGLGGGPTPNGVPTFAPQQQAVPMVPVPTTPVAAPIQAVPQAAPLTPQTYVQPNPAPAVAQPNVSIAAPGPAFVNDPWSSAPPPTPPL